MIPDVIVVGTATGVPNPIKEALKFVQLLNTINTQVNQLKISCINLLNELANIRVTVPEPIKIAIRGIITLSAIVVTTKKEKEAEVEAGIEQAQKDAEEAQRKKEEIEGPKREIQEKLSFLNRANDITESINTNLDSIGNIDI